MDEILYTQRVFNGSDYDTLYPETIVEQVQGAIATTEKGAAGGVATLGNDGKVPSGQLPEMNYIPTSAKGAANGVATLGNNGKVPVSQMPYQYSTVDLISGVSPLATGTLYIVYEG